MMKNIIKNYFKVNKEKEYKFFFLKIKKKELYFWVLNKRTIKIDTYLGKYTKNSKPFNYIEAVTDNRRTNILLDRIDQDISEDSQNLIVWGILDAYNNSKDIRFIIDNYKVDYQKFRDILEKNKIKLKYSVNINFHFLKEDCFNNERSYLPEVDLKKDIFIIKENKDLLVFPNDHSMNLKLYPKLSDKDKVHDYFDQINKGFNFKIKIIKLPGIIYIKSLDEWMVNLILTIIKEKDIGRISSLELKIEDLKRSKIKSNNLKISRFKLNEISSDKVIWEESSLNNFVKIISDY